MRACMLVAFLVNTTRSLCPFGRYRMFETPIVGRTTTKSFGRCERLLMRAEAERMFSFALAASLSVTRLFRLNTVTQANGERLPPCYRYTQLPVSFHTAAGCFQIASLARKLKYSHPIALNYIIVVSSSTASCPISPYFQPNLCIMKTMVVRACSAHAAD